MVVEMVDDLGQFPDELEWKQQELYQASHGRHPDSYLTLGRRVGLRRRPLMPSICEVKYCRRLGEEPAVNLQLICGLRGNVECNIAGLGESRIHL